MNAIAPAQWMERHQVALYLTAIAAAVPVGWTVPAAPALAPAVTPVLGLLLFATFLAVPFPALGRALADARFLVAVLVLNFAVVPVVVFGLSRAVRAFRGIDTLTAFSLHVELGADWRRFATAPALSRRGSG